MSLYALLERWQSFCAALLFVCAGVKPLKQYASMLCRWYAAQLLTQVGVLHDRFRRDYEAKRRRLSWELRVPRSSQRDIKVHWFEVSWGILICHEPLHNVQWVESLGPFLNACFMLFHVSPNCGCSAVMCYSLCRDGEASCSVALNTENERFVLEKLSLGPHECEHIVSTKTTVTWKSTQISCRVLSTVLPFGGG